MTKDSYAFLLHLQEQPNLFLSQWNAEEAGSEVLVQKSGSQFFFFFKSPHHDAASCPTHWECCDKSLVRNFTSFSIVSHCALPDHRLMHLRGAAPRNRAPNLGDAPALGFIPSSLVLSVGRLSEAARLVRDFNRLL